MAYYFLKGSSSSFSVLPRVGNWDKSQTIFTFRRTLWLCQEENQAKLNLIWDAMLREAKDTNDVSNCETLCVFCSQRPRSTLKLTVKITKWEQDTLFILKHSSNWRTTAVGVYKEVKRQAYEGFQYSKRWCQDPSMDWLTSSEENTWQIIMHFFCCLEEDEEGELDVSSSSCPLGFLRAIRTTISPMSAM